MPAHQDTLKDVKICTDHVAQVDYAAVGIFLNVTTDSEDGDSAPWWQLEGSMAPGLEALTPVYERFSPHWWFPDVPKQAIGSIKKLENVVPFLRQVGHSSIQALKLLTLLTRLILGVCKGHSKIRKSTYSVLQRDWFHVYVVA